MFQNLTPSLKKKNVLTNKPRALGSFPETSNTGGTMGRQALQWGHTHQKYRVLSSTLHFTLVQVSYYKCLLSLPENRTFSLSVCFHLEFFLAFPPPPPFAFGSEQREWFIFTTRTRGHQLYWKVSVSFSYRSSEQRGCWWRRRIRYLSEVDPDNKCVSAIGPSGLLTGPSPTISVVFFSPTRETHELMIF